MSNASPWVMPRSAGRKTTAPASSMSRQSRTAALCLRFDLEKTAQIEADSSTLDGGCPYIVQFAPKTLPSRLCSGQQ